MTVHVHILKMGAADGSSGCKKDSETVLLGRNSKWETRCGRL